MRPLSPVARLGRGRSLSSRLGPLIHLSLALHAGGGHAAGLTEQAAMALALSRPAYAQAGDARVAIAQSAVEQSRLLPNPTLEWARDKTDSASGQNIESSVRLAQSFDLSGRRGLHQQAAESRLTAAQQAQADVRLKTLQQVRQQFAETLRLARLSDGQANWLARIEAAHKLVGQLAVAGEASGYDRRRLEREAKAARARLAATQAELAQARALLAALVGQPVEALSGELIPPPPPALETLVAGIGQHPALAGLEAQAAAYGHERKASQRQWLPELTLGVGSKRIRESGSTDNGMMLSLDLPLPVFDRGQAAARRAQAEESALRAEHELLLAHKQAALEGAWRQAVQLRQAAIDFQSQAGKPSRELSAIAEAAYRSGESGILELLDAYRGELDDQATALELALRARLARIELDTLTGARHE